MKYIIDIPEDVIKRTVFYREFRDLNDCITTIKALEKAIPLEDIKTEIKDLHNSHMIHLIDTDGVVDTCLEIIDEHTRENKNGFRS